MIDVQHILVSILRLTVTFFVPAVVWITLTAGLFQLIYDLICRLGGVLSGLQRFAPKSAR